MIRFLRFLPSRWWSPKAWRTWASYVHWRMETYGVFYPAGKTNWKALRSLLGQMPSYNRWLGEMDALRKNRHTTGGPPRRLAESSTLHSPSPR